MRRFLTSLALLLCLATQSLSAASMPFSQSYFSPENVQDQERYIKRYAKIAMREMERSGVPASIKLAQGIWESGAGTSTLARSANNHFGIKCGSNWKGDEYYKEDDDYNDQGRLIKSCFRKYRNADASYVAHSEFLRDPRKAFRYGFLFRLDPTDYKGWARGLSKAGYATDVNYSRRIIDIIERHNLTQYDQRSLLPDPTDDPIAENDRPDRPTTPTGNNNNSGNSGNLGSNIDASVTGILSRNDVSYFVSERPLSVAEIAKQVDLKVDKLLEYNEELDGSGQTVTSGEPVYLQKKRRSYRGRENSYVVQPGEDLYDVAQKFGLRLKNLARRNRLAEDADPATGETVKLRGSRLKQAPRLEGTADPNAPRPTVPTGTDGNIDLDTDDPYGPGTTTPTVTPTNPGTVVIPRPTPPVVRPNPNEAPVTPGTTPTQPNGNAQFHTVAAGETLYAISRRYGMTVDALQRLNGLTTTNLSVGQQLRIR